jgi:hypothetical protein
MTPPENNTEEAMQKLFTAKWNIPQAVQYLNKKACFEEWESLKEEFRKYCRENPPTWRG